MIRKFILAGLLTAASPLFGQTSDAGSPTVSQDDSSAEAVFSRANRHHDGDGVLQNFATAAGLYEQAADLGHAGAQNRLGQYYHSGLGVAQNQQTALHWLMAAADQGDPQYIFDLASALEQGANGSSDPTRAAEHYQQAATKGHADAAVSLGVLYQNGTGVDQDFTRAHDLYRGPAGEGHARAQNNLGLLYVRGTGAAQDYERAATLFAAAAEQGLATAMTNLSVMYGNGFGVAQSDELAAEWERLASQQRQAQGFAAASPDAALCQFDPRLSPPPDDPAAAAQQQRAAKGGDPVAQFLLGWQLCSYPEASATDLRQAVGWFKAAATAGHGPSMINLGWLYLQGRGVPQDYMLGYMWLTLAQSVGQPLALENSAALRQKMTPAQINEAQQRAAAIWQEIHNH